MTETTHRLTPLLDRLGLALALWGVVLRWTAPAAGFGTNLLVHLVLCIPLVTWLLTRALGGGGVFRLGGVGIASLGFVAVCLLSIFRASYPLPAMDLAAAFLSYALLYLYLRNTMGQETVVSLLIPTLLALSIHALLQRFLYFPRLLSEYDPAMYGPLSTEMGWRIASNEVFATFTGPNQFAAFLALILPLLAGMIADNPRRPFRWVALAAGVTALALTRSKGGWVALGVAVLTGVSLWLTRDRYRKLAVAIGGGLLGLGLLLLTFTPLLSRMAERSYSMAVRQTYWHAAGKIFAASPILGVGIDNYQEHYPAAKSESQHEVTRVHNDYLQVLVDLGLFGGLALLAIVIPALRSAFWRDPPQAEFSSIPRPGWLVPTAAGTAFLGSWLVGGTLPAEAAVIMAASWVGYYLLDRPGPESAIGTGTRIGAAAGLVAFLVHMTVDFDLYDLGLGLGFFLSLALITVSSEKACEVKVSGRASAAAAVLLLLVLLPSLLYVVPRALAADGDLEQATEALRELHAGARKGRTWRELVDAAVRLSTSAREKNPYLSDCYRVQVEATLHAWRLAESQRPNVATGDRILAGLPAPFQVLEEGIGRRPRSAPLHELGARLYREASRAALSKMAIPGLAPGESRNYLAKALGFQKEAADLYPTYAPVQYQLARLLDDNGMPDEARRRYQEALRLTTLAERERYSLERMKVNPIGRARCLLRLGRSQEALDTLVTTFRRSLPTDETLDEEMDALMRPVIQEAKSISSGGR